MTDSCSDPDATGRCKQLDTVVLAPFEAVRPCVVTAKRRCGFTLMLVLGLSLALAVCFFIASSPDKWNARSSAALELSSSDLAFRSNRAGWPVRSIDSGLHGPFPRIGMYGDVPRMDANIVDDREDPQEVVTSCQTDPISVGCTGGFGGGPKFGGPMATRVFGRLDNALGDRPEQDGPIVVQPNLWQAFMYMHGSARQGDRNSRVWREPVGHWWQDRQPTISAAAHHVLAQESSRGEVDNVASSGSSRGSSQTNERVVVNRQGVPDHNTVNVDHQTALRSHMESRGQVANELMQLKDSRKEMVQLQRTIRLIESRLLDGDRRREQEGSAASAA